MTGTNYAIAALMAVCCFLAVAGAPLPWFAADTGFGTVSVSGLSGEIDSVGSWSMISALVVTGLFVLTLITKRLHLLVKIGLIFFVSAAMSESGGVGIGLWMTTWGGIGMVAASIWGSVKWNAAISPAS